MIYCDDIQNQGNHFSQLYQGTSKLAEVSYDFSQMPLTLKSSKQNTYQIHLGEGFTNVEYKKGVNGEWISAVGDANNDFTINCSVNEPLSLRANYATRQSTTSETIFIPYLLERGFRINATQEYSAYGNVNSLLNKTTNITSLTNYDWAFAGLFRGNFTYRSDSQETYWTEGEENKLINISKLLIPNSILSEGCYFAMFANSLIYNTTNLIATTLANRCYHSLFAYCKNLKDIPSNLLPATTLAAQCYYLMFYNCKKITNLPTLSATTLYQNCYSYMFENCTGITSIPSGYLPATNLAQACYTGMFRNCTNITSVPTSLLPATSIPTTAYRDMFKGCTKLTNVPNLNATNLNNSCYYEMFSDCSSLTTVPGNLLPATALANNCYTGMFKNCIGLISIPDLPATTTVPLCYANMFGGCTRISTASLPATYADNQCYASMFSGCTNLRIVYVYATSFVDAGQYRLYSPFTNMLPNTSGTIYMTTQGLNYVNGTTDIPISWTRVHI